MATAKEVTLADAIAVAEMNRQISKAAAFVTYAWAPANLATYLTALGGSRRCLCNGGQFSIIYRCHHPQFRIFHATWRPDCHNCKLGG